MIIRILVIVVSYHPISYIFLNVHIIYLNVYIIWIFSLADDGCNIAVESFQTLCLFRVNRSCSIQFTTILNNR